VNLELLHILEINLIPSIKDTVLSKYLPVALMMVFAIVVMDLMKFIPQNVPTLVLLLQKKKKK
jgi:hypothetical protein